MVDAKQAVKIAKEYVEEMYLPEKLPRLGLEEIELVDEFNEWIITVGFDAPSAEETPTEFQRLVGRTGKRREYKRVRIAAQTGNVLSMKKFMPSSES